MTQIQTSSKAGSPPRRLLPYWKCTASRRQQLYNAQPLTGYRSIMHSPFQAIVLLEMHSPLQAIVLLEVHSPLQVTALLEMHRSNQ